MASALKRKRGRVEALDTPKRFKSVKESQNHLPTPKLSQVGWETAFNPPPKSNELVQSNGINGDGTISHNDSGSPEAVDFEEFVGQSKRPQEGEKRRKKLDEKYLRRALAKKDANLWKLSEPIGGRQINVDPVFTADEKFLILANRTTVHVYSTSNSLLTRSIKLDIDAATRPNAHIITYCLSPTDPNIVWVACSDGAIYSIDWTSGVGAEQYWGISSTGCIHMTVASMESGGRRRDIVFTTEIRRDGGWRITANELAAPKGPIETVARTIYTSNQRIDFLKTAKEGSIIAAASEKRVLIGNLRSTEYDTIDKIRYEFRVFESTDFVSSLDLKVYNRTGIEGLKKSVLKRLPVVDVVVGDIKGSIFVHSDLLGNLARSHEDTLSPGISLIPRKLHWHRQAVLTVKWSLDGNYIISGGTENVLVLWQLDTGKQQFLPHMSATIQNVVVSPSGVSYGVQLADNSTMVLSVAELKPTANFAGIQASVLGDEEVLESNVRRIEGEHYEHPLVQRTVAVVSPTDPARLLLGVGQRQEFSHNNPVVTSIPFLQTFDLGLGHNVSRQALTRSNVTNINITPSALRISEPRVTHMKISFDGDWLATVDEWTPPKQDLDFIGHQGISINVERHRRREVHLKFWQWSKEENSWTLVSRIDTPHLLNDGSSSAGRVLDLAADPRSLRFSTIGEDGVVRTWSSKSRKRDGVIVRDKNGHALRNWNCQHAISIGKPEPSSDLGTTPRQPANGCVAFSEDGSVLAAAHGNNQGLLHLLDPDLGIIRVSKVHMFEGGIVKVGFLGQDLITLSNQLIVYDLVLDEVRYSLKLGSAVTSLSMEQKVEMMHLAVNQRSGSFAVALPCRLDRASVKGVRKQSLLSKCSELAIFHQDKREPVLKENLSLLVTALLPAVGSDGYLVLDAAAEIRSVLKKGSQAVTLLAQSTSDLQLNAPEEDTSALLHVEDDVEDVEEIHPPSPTFNVDEGEVETPVVTQQQLSEIFDIGPSFALPPMEEMFYHVADLFSCPPLPQNVS